LIGLGWPGDRRRQRGEFLASDVPALLAHTRARHRLDDGDIARILRRAASRSSTASGEPARAPSKPRQWSPMAEKGGHKHFMLKEIHEQPRAITDTLRGRVLLEATVHLDGRPTMARRLRAGRAIVSSSPPAAPPGTPAWWAST
jgi:glucosamine--fructose-6-phosphate aminotransferase (isomerizing)